MSEWVGLDMMMYTIIGKGGCTMVSKAQIKAQSKWIKTVYDECRIRIRKDAEITKDDIMDAAMLQGESLNQYILEAIRMRIESER